MQQRRSGCHGSTTALLREEKEENNNVTWTKEGEKVQSICQPGFRIQCVSAKERGNVCHR